MTAKRASAAPCSAHAADLSVARGALRRDPSALAELTQRLAKVAAMVRYRNRQLGSPLSASAADEVAHDVMAAVWLRLNSYSARASLASWIYGFCVLQVHKALVRQRRGGEASGATAAEVAAAATSSPTDFEDVHAALEALGPVASEPIRMRFFEHCTLDEIAVRLQEPVSTVKSRYYRAMDQLRRWLAPGREA